MRLAGSGSSWITSRGWFMTVIESRNRISPERLWAPILDIFVDFYESKPSEAPNGAPTGGIGKGAGRRFLSGSGAGRASGMPAGIPPVHLQRLSSRARGPSGQGPTGGSGRRLLRATAPCQQWGRRLRRGLAGLGARTPRHGPGNRALELRCRWPIRRTQARRCTCQCSRRACIGWRSTRKLLWLVLPGMTHLGIGTDFCQYTNFKNFF